MKNKILLILFLAALMSGHAFSEDALIVKKVPSPKTISITLEENIAPSWWKKKSVTLEPDQELIVSIDNSKGEYHNSTMQFGHEDYRDRDTNAIFYEIENAWSSIFQRLPLKEEIRLNTTGETLTYHFRALDSAAKNTTIYFYTPVSSDAPGHNDWGYFSPGIDVTISGQ